MPAVISGEELKYRAKVTGLTGERRVLVGDVVGFLGGVHLREAWLAQR
jgi:hypothetical protein